MAKLLLFSYSTTFFFMPVSCLFIGVKCLPTISTMICNDINFTIRDGTIIPPESFQVAIVVPFLGHVLALAVKYENIRISSCVITICKFTNSISNNISLFIF